MVTFMVNRPETFNRMLRVVYNKPWWEHTTNKELCGTLLSISTEVRRRRLSLAGHVTQHGEPAGKLLFWSPEANRSRGHPYLTLKDFIEAETGLCDKDLTVMMNVNASTR